MKQAVTSCLQTINTVLVHEEENLDVIVGQMIRYWWCLCDVCYVQSATCVLHVCYVQSATCVLHVNKFRGISGLVTLLGISL